MVRMRIPAYEKTLTRDVCSQVNPTYINAQNAWLQTNLAASTATYNIVTVRACHPRTHCSSATIKSATI